MYILDFVFNENTGVANIVVDFFDESMTVMEMNLAIHDGEIRENITKKVGQIFGLGIENQLREGQIELICLDDNPKEKVSSKIQINHDISEEIKKENLI